MHTYAPDRIPDDATAGTINSRDLAIGFTLIGTIAAAIDLPWLASTERRTIESRAALRQRLQQLRSSAGWFVRQAHANHPSTRPWMHSPRRSRRGADRENRHGRRRRSGNAPRAIRRSG
jgi:hypothetical protein